MCAMALRALAASLRNTRGVPDPVWPALQKITAFAGVGAGSGANASMVATVGVSQRNATSTSGGTHAEGIQVGRLNHVAIAVPCLKQAVDHYRKVFNAKVGEAQALQAHGVTVAFVELDNTKIELLEPLGAESPISAFLQRNPAGGVHHVCLEVAHMSAAFSHVQQHSRLLSQQPQIGAHGTPVVFMHPKDNQGVLVELEEVAPTGRVTPSQTAGMEQTE